MKKVICVVMALIFSVLVGATANAQSVAPIKFISNTRVVKGGASVYMMDMSLGNLKDTEIISVQFIGATPYIPTTGATVPQISFGTSDKLHGGISDTDNGKLFTSTQLQEIIEFTPITPKQLVHTTGVSQFVFTSAFDPSKYGFLKVNNTGTTDFKVSAVAAFHKKGKKPSPIYTGQLVFNLTSTTGTSAFTSTDSNGVYLPHGTRYLIAQNSTTSGVSVLYSHNKETISTTASSYIDAGDRMVFEGQLQTLRELSIRALGTTTITFECWTGKPY